MVLVIGYGNTLRWDDGAGVALAERIERVLLARGVAVDCLIAHQLTPEMSETIAGASVEAVVFVDTRLVSGNGDGVLRAERLDGMGNSPGMGHHLDPCTLLLLARELFGRVPPAWLVTVPGVDFQHGEGFSVLTRNALDSLPRLLDTLPEGWPLEG